MQAIIHQNGRPILKERPKPQRCLETDVLLRVLKAGLCRTDVQAGFGHIPTGNNRILGHEFVGQVEEVSQQSMLSIGQKVAIFPNIPCMHCHRCKDNHHHKCQNPSFLGIDRDGCFSEYIVVPEPACYLLPDSLSLERAAYVEPVAAALAVLDCDIQPQQSGLLLGTGRIANLCFHLLKHNGFHNIELAEQPPNTARFDFIIECNLQKIKIDQLLLALRDGGLLILKSRAAKQEHIDVQQLIRRSLRIQGAYYGSFLKAIQMLCNDSFAVEAYFGSTYSLADFVTLFQADEEVKLFCAPTCVE